MTDMPTCQRVQMNTPTPPQHQHHADKYDRHFNTAPHQLEQQTGQHPQCECHRHHADKYDRHTNTPSTANTGTNADAIKYNSKQGNTSTNANGSNDQHANITTRNTYSCLIVLLLHSSCALCFFPCKSKVFLLQESHCNIAILGTLVVTYDVACVMMLTHLLPTHSHLAPLRL